MGTPYLSPYYSFTAGRLGDGLHGTYLNNISPAKAGLTLVLRRKKP
jgi:hypothetical protein